MIERATIARLESRLQQRLGSTSGHHELGSESMGSIAGSSRILQLARLPEPAAVPPTAPRTLAEFLALNDAVLIQSGYRFLLGRAPDHAGFAYHLSALREGRITKEQFLVSLRYSDEGQKKNVQIHGLNQTRFRLRMARVPVVGVVLRWLSALASVARLVRRVRGLETQVAAHESVVSSTVNGVFDALELSVNAQAGDVDRLRRVTLETARRSEEANENAGARLEALAQRVEGRIAPAELTLKYLEPLVQRLAKAVDARGRGNVVAAAAPAPKPEDLDAFYADFEDRFRGSRQLIKERQRVYLPYLVDLPEPRTAIDVGSGRGEWLELLRDAGWKATGFDTNLVFATRNRERGLDVQLGDGLALLRELGDGDVSLVTVFHLIEHLPFEDWLSMLDECRRVLRPGGMLILETPNPENLTVGALHFYVDPTHRNPIPPALAEFVVKARGFEDVAVLRLHEEAAPNPEEHIAASLSALFYGPQDYAILARKP